MLRRAACGARLCAPSPATSREVMDRLSKSQRSWLMSQVRGKDTTPELVVRKYLHALGFRYRLHGKELPGKPDIVLPKYRTVIFVHGCFWHRHRGCRYASTPRSNAAFWTQKFESNVARDKKNAAALRKAGWRCLIIWGCETKLERRLERLVQRIVKSRYAVGVCGPGAIPQTVTSVRVRLKDGCDRPG